MSSLSKLSSDEEIESFIKNYNDQVRDKGSDLNYLLSITDEISNLEPDTYRFYFGCNRFIQNTDNPRGIEILETYLRNISSSGSPPIDTDRCFTIYYLVHYYYWETKQITKLNNLVNNYSHYFDNYALAYQVRGRLSRKNKKYKEALAYDKKANEILKNKHIINDSVRYTTAASVANALENGYFGVVTEEDIEEALRAADEAISKNQKYHKWQYLKAKLLIYSTDYYAKKKERKKYSNYKEKVEEAIDYLNKAIDFLDSSSKSYDSQKMKYESYRLQADRIASEIGLQEQLLDANERLMQINSKQIEIESILHNEQIKYLEILAVFVSVITIIVTIMGTVNKNFSVQEMIQIIAALNVSVLGVYSAFVLLIKKFSFRPLFVETICIVIIVLMLKPALTQKIYLCIETLLNSFLKFISSL